MTAVTLEGRVAIITGGGGGLGRSHALDFAHRGASVLVNDLGVTVAGSGTDESAAEQVAKEINSSGGVAVANHDSVATVEGGQAIVEAALERFGRVDILVNNAGFLRDGAMHNGVPDGEKVIEGKGQTPEGVGDIVAVHLLGAFNLLRYAWPQMRNQGYGRIISTSSGAGMFGNFGQANYGAAKAALVGLTRVLAVEGASKGILANAIVPVAKTRMTEDIFEGYKAAGVEIDPSILTPGSITAVVSYLASEACVYSGEAYGCGGGYVSRIFTGETKGMTFGSTITAEDVAANIDGIRNTEGFTIPANLEAQLLAVLQLIGG